MASENRGRKRDSLLNPLNWVKRSRALSSAARGDLSTASQTNSTSRLEVFQRSSVRARSSLSSSPSIQTQDTQYLTITSLEPQVVSDAPNSSPSHPSDLWRRAFRRANVIAQKWIEEQGLDLRSADEMQVQTQIEEIIGLMKSKELPEDVDQPLTITIANHKIIVREYLADVIAFVTMLGDAASIFAPPQASEPWVVAKAVMKVCRFFFFL